MAQDLLTTYKLGGRTYYQNTYDAKTEIEECTPDWLAYGVEEKEDEENWRHVQFK